ncbi:MAG: nickel pincer cofactor biosynthesis protein LarC [Acidimicrobiales bacterium]
MTTLWLDPGFGASGDMLLGVLVGLGVPVDDLRSDLAELGVEGWSLEESAVQRAGIDATRVEVRLNDDASSTHHRSWSSIDRLLADASHLTDRVRCGARQTFRMLGEVEAGIHGVSIDEVHFHEVGAVDAIVDIVATWAALDRLGVSAVHAGPIGLGSGGTVSTAHGQLPVPAPATLKLLEGLPIAGLDSPSESVTPTGAALLATAVDTWGAIPSGHLIASARGAGGRNPDTHPNAITGILIETAAKAATDAAPEQTVTAIVLATNIDDATPEILGHTLNRLLEAGADDAWLVPIGMKKSRPGHELRVLCSPDLASDLRHIIFTETGTLGIRSETIAKHMLPRRFETVEVHGHKIRVKVGPYSSKPEYEDLVEASRATGIPIHQLANEVEVKRSQNRPSTSS